ncbi:MAG: hypothetical protein WD014_01840 [Dongiaceae bacterium]
MRKFPAEFADLLTPAGRRVLDGAGAEACGALANPRRRFIALEGMIEPAKAEAARRLLDRALHDVLTPMADPIPPETIWEMTENYGEWLPKTMRLKTAYLERRGSRAWRAAERIGLIALLRSESLAAFVTAVAGRALARDSGAQVLCYGPGDYAGPHNDHHPEDPSLKFGYIDCHISLASPAVAHQWLVYAERGHFTRIESVNTLGGITIYRLPFWHYTTPLAPRPGEEATARRWVLLGSFPFAEPEKRG